MKICRKCGRPRDATRCVKAALCAPCNVAHVKAWKIANPARAALAERLRRRARPGRELLNSARQRAHARGLEFDIVEADIRIPERCPVLGIALTWNRDKGPGFGHRACPASPTVDRIDNSRGYVRGNVAVISHRANSIKRDATLAELENLVAWLRGKIAREQV